MTQFTSSEVQRHFSPAASLAALGMHLRQIDLFGPIRDSVKIAQKTVKHTPCDKLYDALISILAGAHGLVEINTRLRSDPALQRAFGRNACAEQSVVQDTLNSCRAEQVTQMEQALQTIYRQHSQGYTHDYKAAWQLLDVDLTGMPCGKKAAFASKGYFPQQRYRRGRQLGRVLASNYHEIVVDQLGGGITYLRTALRPLMEAAEQVLELSAAKRARTIVRVDAGGGSVSCITWLLSLGYQVMAKDYSGQRAQKLALSVTRWVDDPRIDGRQVGWVRLPPTAYARPVRRIAVRCRKKNGAWGVGVIISTLEAETVLALTNQPATAVMDDAVVLLAYVYFYDARGGGVETAIKDDKQGLGITKRNKKRFEAQQMVMLLNVLAHNALVWARGWLAGALPELQRYGVLRLVRDVWHISGFVERDRHGDLTRIVLNQLAPLARGLGMAFRQLLAPTQVVINLGQT
ncbi:MAG TPA: transposase [Candidatus Angelobacter sp.]|nr:transposase [Candidatus Angelobacter sp.]